MPGEFTRDKPRRLKYNRSRYWAHKFLFPEKVKKHQENCAKAMAKSRAGKAADEADECASVHSGGACAETPSKKRGRKKDEEKKQSKKPRQDPQQSSPGPSTSTGTGTTSGTSKGKKKAGKPKPAEGGTQFRDLPFDSLPKRLRAQIKLLREEGNSKYSFN